MQRRLSLRKESVVEQDLDPLLGISHAEPGLLEMASNRGNNTESHHQDSFSGETDTTIVSQRTSASEHASNTKLNEDEDWQRKAARSTEAFVAEVTLQLIDTSATTGATQILTPKSCLKASHVEADRVSQHKRLSTGGRRSTLSRLTFPKFAQLEEPPHEN